jgi:putative FmdB family regulatory protein
MPIYAYRCSDCGFQKDYLQKLSDPVLTDCPECGKATFAKQLTAAGFQLKGNGWYATDFKSGSKPADTSNNTSTGSDKPAATENDKPAAETATAHACGTGTCASCS